MNDKTVLDNLIIEDEYKDLKDRKILVIRESELERIAGLIRENECTRLKCNALIVALVGAEYCDAWWNSSNRAFKGERPIDCDIKEVYRYLLDFFGK